jgi:hypothetical protein
MFVAVVAEPVRDCGARPGEEARVLSRSRPAEKRALPDEDEELSGWSVSSRSTASCRSAKNARFCAVMASDSRTAHCECVPVSSTFEACGLKITDDARPGRVTTPLPTS